MSALSRPIPLDVLVLIKAEIDPKLIGPHLALSNVSRQVRDCVSPQATPPLSVAGVAYALHRQVRAQRGGGAGGGRRARSGGGAHEPELTAFAGCGALLQLYADDGKWKVLLNAAGIGRSVHDLEAVETTRLWRDIAVEVARHEQDEGTPGACALSSKQEIDVANGDDGESLCKCLCVRVREINCQYPDPAARQTCGEGSLTVSLGELSRLVPCPDRTFVAPHVVYTEEQVREQNLWICPHEMLFDFDCEGTGYDFLAFMPRYFGALGRALNVTDGRLCRDHPVFCHSVRPLRL